MGWEALFSLASVLFCFGMMAFTRVSPDLITSAALTVLLLAGVVSPEQALAGFANQGMLTVAVLYVVVSGLTETGAVGWIGQTLLGRPRSIRHAQWRLMLPVAGLSAFLNNTPVVAVFIPALQEWARRHRLQLSKLLIPLSFASIAGGTCTLIGSSTNLLVNGLMLEQTGSGLALFDLLWIGLPVSLAVLLFVLLMGSWLLPNRSSAMEEFADVRAYTVEMQVEVGSPLPGRSIDEAGLRQLPGLFLAEIEREGGVLPAVSSKERLQAGDRLLFVGARDSVVDLQRIHGLLPATNQLFKLNDERPERRFIEAVVSSRHPLVGRTVREGRFRNRYNAVIIALARNGERLDGKLGDQRLQAGDTLLLEARPSFLEQQRNAQDWLLISPVGESHPLQHERAPLALGIVLLMVLLVGLGWLSMLKGALLAAGLMILTRCTRGQVAR
ncbi:potassium transporter TrkA, partial [Candidatus Endoriftia persephone str. Guaymas]|nr:potassium transporter TrkA [Candidatus Endoriftia persephone str. Guaymas]